MSRPPTRLLGPILALLLLAPPASAHMPGDYGDAPEGTLAYPTEGIAGAFPTCYASGPAGYVYHAPVGSMRFGAAVSAFDAESDGAGCDGGMPDGDECFDDPDAGLIAPVPCTIRDGAVVACTEEPPVPLGAACQLAQWGVNLDIRVVSEGPTAFVNVLVDWNRDGSWGGASACPGRGEAPEQILANFEISGPADGPLSELLDASNRSFLVGPAGGPVWARFTISPTPVEEPWTGEGSFADGETEDYLLTVEPPTAAEPSSWGRIKSLYR